MSSRFFKVFSPILTARFPGGFPVHFSCPLTPIFSRFFGNVPRTPTPNFITVTFMFYSFVCFHIKSNLFVYIFGFFHFHSVVALTGKIGEIASYFLVNECLAWSSGRDFRNMLVSQSLWVYYGSHFLGFILEDFSAKYNFNLLQNSKLISHPTQL